MTIQWEVSLSAKNVELFGITASVLLLSRYLCSPTICPYSACGTLCVINVEEVELNLSGAPEFS